MFHYSTTFYVYMEGLKFYVFTKYCHTLTWKNGYAECVEFSSLIQMAGPGQFVGSSGASQRESRGLCDNGKSYIMIS